MSVLRCLSLKTAERRAPEALDVLAMCLSTSASILPLFAMREPSYVNFYTLDFTISYQSGVLFSSWTARPATFSLVLTRLTSRPKVPATSMYSHMICSAPARDVAKQCRTHICTHTHTQEQQLALQYTHMHSTPLIDNHHTLLVQLSSRGNY